MLEILRRVFLIIGLQAALWMALLPVPALLQVKVMDFAAMFKQAPGWERGSQTLPEYIQSRTSGRSLAVSGAAWEAFLADLTQASAGAPPDQAWRKRAGSVAGYFYFRLDEAPLAAVTSDLGPEKTVIYLVWSRAETNAYLQVYYDELPYMLSSAPAALAYPNRANAFWPLAAGVLLYFALPRPRHSPAAVTYGAFRAVIMPDLAAALLSTLFVALPLLVITNVSGPLSSITDGGWWAFGLFFVLLALAFLPILVVDAGRACFEVLPLPDSLRITTWRGRSQYAWRDLSGVTPARQETPRWLGRAAWIVNLLALFSGRRVRVVGSGSLSGICLAFRDGRRVNVWQEGARNYNALLDYLHRAGVEAPVA